MSLPVFVVWQLFTASYTLWPPIGLHNKCGYTTESMSDRHHIPSAEPTPIPHCGPCRGQTTAASLPAQKRTKLGFLSSSNPHGNFGFYLRRACSYFQLSCFLISGNHFTLKNISHLPREIGTTEFLNTEDHQPENENIFKKHSHKNILFLCQNTLSLSDIIFWNSHVTYK